MTRHEIKVLPQWFDAVANGVKTCEIRAEDDKIFAVGDTLALSEYDPTLARKDANGNVRYGHTTGRHCAVGVTHILRHADFPDGIPEGYAVLSIRVVLD